jgi:hypothetical protein
MEPKLIVAGIDVHKRMLGIARGSVESNDSRVVHSTTPFLP